VSDSVPPAPPEEPLRGVSPGVASALAQARAFGYLGPGPLQVHVDHAHGFANAVQLALDPLDGNASPLRVVDLGSGGGVPGLVLAEAWPSSSWTFVDSNQRRMGTLTTVLAELGLDARCSVEVGRAEQVAHVPALRATFDVVVARGFAAPSVTAECAAGFLREGGVVIVSEPPGGKDRWSDRGLARLGLTRRPSPVGEFRFFVAEQTSLCPPTYPRPIGIPAKTPLF
jgi:16S rRNA (guanine527-N7)-methyltransferase